MSYRRKISDPPAEVFSGLPESREELVGRSIRREASESLRHQLRLEQEVKSEMQRSDYFFTVAAVSFFGGLGLMLGSGLSGRSASVPVKRISRSIKRSSRRGGS